MTDINSRADTSLQGLVEATYTDLAQALGQPGAPWDEDKSHAEWTLSTPHGLAVIYDYGDLHGCDPDCYRDPRHAADEPWEWHIGGHNQATAQWVELIATGRLTVRHRLLAAGLREDRIAAHLSAGRVHVDGVPTSDPDAYAAPPARVVIGGAA